MKVYGLVLSAMLLVASHSVLSFEFDSSVGFSYLIGVIDDEQGSDADALSDASTQHFRIHYETYLSDHFAIGASYLEGDSSDANITVFEALTRSSLQYNALGFDAKLLLPLGKTNAFYLAGKLHQYDYEIVNDGRVVVQNDGSDLGYSIGWQYKWPIGIGLDVQFYEVLRLGNGLDIRNSGVGISYSF